MSSELENSGIRVAVGDCSVTECRRWRPPYQTGKTVHVHAKHYKHKEDGRTVPGVCGNGSVPLSHSGNVVTRIAIHTQIILSLTADLLIAQLLFGPRRQTLIKGAPHRHSLLTLLHSEKPKLYGVLAFLGAIGLKSDKIYCHFFANFDAHFIDFTQ